MAASCSSNPWLPVPPQRQFTLPALCPPVLRAPDLPAALRPGAVHLLWDSLPSLPPSKVCGAQCNRQSLSMGLCCMDGEGEGYFAQSLRF